MLVASIFSFSLNVFLLIKDTYITILATMNLSSASALNLVKAKFLLFN